MVKWFFSKPGMNFCRSRSVGDFGDYPLPLNKVLNE